MSDKPTVTIEIDGTTLEAEPGAMLIDIADANGIVIPRFCYHKKLSVAANCRMCLVEVEKAPKPLPACATPVTDGMKVFTRSPKAIAAQKATMEFLLINHPLDCPICDQGGECELQDVAMGYGGDVSHYTEGKRVVPDKNIGPLIATEMTRCIHCTRCVRFGEEIAGVRELGATGRGENTRIGTYIEQAVTSELSGNVIDLCPVGALTARPSRYSARAWELRQHDSIAPHDCVGSNISVHTFRGRVNRVVPRDHEQVNECWISDRDRFSYQALSAKERLHTPLIKVDGEWKETDWQTALEAVHGAITGTVREYSPDQVGMLVSPSATLEEMYLLRKIANHLQCNNIDHRLRQRDFSHQQDMPRFPSLGSSIVALEQTDAVLLVGSNPRKEQPLIAHRLRKAAAGGAQICLINQRDYDLAMPVAVSVTASYRGLVEQMANLAKAIPNLDVSALTPAAKELYRRAVVSDAIRGIAERLCADGESHVLLGNQAIANPYFSLLEVFARAIARVSNSRFGYLTDGANSAGAWLSGVVPHRDAGGAALETPALHAQAMLEEPRNLYLLHNVEPEFDCADAATALAAMRSADHVICLTPFVSAEMKRYATILLPVAAFAETSGSYVNIEGRLQSFSGHTPGGDNQARPAWKVLRVLGNSLEVEECEFNSSTEVRDALLACVGEISPDNEAVLSTSAEFPSSAEGDGVFLGSEVNLYRTDNITRRAAALQQTPDAQDDAVHINSTTAERLGLAAARQVRVRYNGAQVSAALLLDETVADDTIWVYAATEFTKKLGPMFGVVELEAN